MYPKVIARRHIILLLFCLTLTAFTIFGGVSSPASYTIAPDSLVAKMVQFIGEFRNESTFFSYWNSTKDFALLSRSRTTEPTFSSEISKKTTDGWKTILFWNSWFGVPWKYRYGGCGNISCYHRDPLGNLCWQNMLSGNYSFYLSMENNLCVDYITEKLYNPLLHNIVPVVWGGGDYDRFLPPHSYINARHYHPQELARLLTRLHQDPVAYGRYHVWRGYLQASNQGSMCELCNRLHTDTSYSHHTDVSGWRMRSGRCQAAPRNMFDSTLGKGAWRTVISTNYDKLFNASLVR